MLMTLVRHHKKTARMATMETSLRMKAKKKRLTKTQLMATTNSRKKNKRRRSMRMK